MSAGARRVAPSLRRKPNPEIEWLIEVAKLSARVGGCSCSPDVSVRVLKPGVFATTVAHDSWCKHTRCPDGCRCALGRLAEGPQPTQAKGRA